MSLVWQIVKPDGSVTYVALSPSREAVERFKQWAIARSGETSTHLGAGLIALGSPLISQAVAQFTAGDYLGFTQTIIPVIVAIMGGASGIAKVESASG